MTEYEQEIENTKAEIAQLQIKLDQLKAKQPKPSKEEIAKIVEYSPSQSQSRKEVKFGY